MSTVSLKDYLFSMKRGRVFEIIQILSSFVLKFILFKAVYLSSLLLIKNVFNKNSVRRILIYFPISSGIGDLIMSNLFFKKIRDEFPESEIYIFSKNGIFIDQSYYDEMIDIGSVSFLDQVSKIKTMEIDLILLPEKSLKSSLMFLFGKSKFKLGYIDSYNLKANFKINSIEFLPHRQHYSVKSYNLILALTENNTANYPSYKPDLSFFKFSDQNLKQDYILFIPYDKWGNRSISFEYANLVVAEVLKTGHTIYLCGGKESYSRNVELLKLNIAHKDKVLIKNDLSLLEFVDVIHNSRAVICSDGGHMNIAYGLDKPVLSYWGPTFPEYILPDTSNPKSVVINEKNNCAVSNCYNMEHKPFCKSCLRLNHIPDFSLKVKEFLLSLEVPIN